MSIEAVTVGDIVIAPILDATLTLAAADAADGVPARDLAAATDGIVDAGQIRLPVICHLIAARGRLVLVNSGVGARARRGWPYGTLATTLARAGVAPGDIDIVVNTHMHADHVGWNTVEVDGTAATRAFFPNARYVFSRVEWDHWMRPEHLGAPGNEHLLECVSALADSVDIELVDGDAPIIPTITAVATPGHTPGHLAIGVDSGGERALLVGDVTHYRAQLDHPDWSPRWDLHSNAAAATRAGVFDGLADDPAATIVTSHWPYPGIGRIVRTGSRRIFASAELGVWPP